MRLMLRGNCEYLKFSDVHRFSSVRPECFRKSWFRFYTSVLINLVGTCIDMYRLFSIGISTCGCGDSRKSDRFFVVRFRRQIGLVVGKNS